ncbi:MAG: hypothetical protein RSC25_08080, partial [Christensenella sp.]
MTLNNVTASVTASSKYAYAGAVAGFVTRGTFERITVNNVNITLTNTNGWVHIGGAFGEIDNTTVNNCEVNGSITGNATNTSSSRSYMGGFAGYFNTCNVKNSAANVDVINNVNYIVTGGFAGNIGGGEYVGNKCSGKVNITQTVAGNVTDQLQVGGFAGQLSNANNVRNNVSSSVITFGASSYAVANPYVGGFAGLSNTPAANYSNNTYLGTVGANGYFAAQVALRVSSNSNPNITDDAQIRRVTAPAPNFTNINMQEIDKDYTVEGAAAAFGYSANWSIDNPKFALSAVAGDSVRVRQVVPLATGNETATLTVTYKKAGAADIVKTVSIKGVIGVPDFATFLKIGTDTAGGYTLDRGYLQTASFDMANAAYTPIAIRGTYDGGNYIIDAKNVAPTNWQTVVVDGTGVGFGLFGRIDGGSVKNMTLNNMTANVTESAYTRFIIMGAVVGYTRDGTFERINVNNVNITLTNTNAGIVIGGAFG